MLMNKINGINKSQPTNGKAHAKHKTTEPQTICFHKVRSGKILSLNTLTMLVNPILDKTIKKVSNNKAGMVSKPLINGPVFSATESNTKAIEPKNKKLTMPKPNERPDV